MVWILALAVALRLPLLFDSLWLDETIEALALQGHYGRLWNYALSDFQPPLYHYLLKAWTNLAGYSEWALRAPSLLTGVALVYVVYLLARHLAGERAGKLAALLTATNPLLIYYSAEGRTYIMTALFVTASFYFLLRLLNNSVVRANNYLPLLYLLSTALALWSSYLAWIALALPSLYLLVAKRRRLALLPLAAYLSLLPWLPSLYRSLSLGLGDAGSMPEWGRVVGEVSAKALALTWVKAVIGRISFSPNWLYAAIVGGLVVLHASLLRRLHRPHPLFWLWLAAIPVLALVSLFVPVYSYTRVLFVVPAYLVLLSLSLARLKPVWTLVLIGTQLLCLGIYYFTPRFHKEDWRGLVGWLNTQSGVVVQPTDKLSPPLVYYKLTLPLSSSPIPQLQGSPLHYLYFGESIFDPELVGRGNLEQSGYTLVKEVSFNQLPVEIYEKL